jgi:hypothetical protein
MTQDLKLENKRKVMAILFIHPKQTKPADSYPADKTSLKSPAFRLSA